MEIRITEQELASLFSTMLELPLEPSDVSIYQETGEVVLRNIPVEKILRLHALTSPHSTPSVETSFQKEHFTYVDAVTGAESENDDTVDLLDMANLHAQSVALAEAGIRPLGPGESYEPPGEPTPEELAAKRLRRR